MKKVFAMVIALSMMLALAITSSAAVPESNFTVTRVSTAPTIDGAYSESEGWGTPIIDVTGQEMYDYVTGSGEQLYLPWAVMEMPYYQRTDGSVEALQGTTLKVYAKWDDDNLYMCYVVSGLPNFYVNPTGVWYGNSIQLTFGQDNATANWSQNAHDPDKDGVYDPGYVGNEYTISIKGGGKTTARVTYGTFNGKSSANMITKNSPIVANNYNTYQVYEMTLPFSAIGVAPATNKEIPFATALNINMQSLAEEETTEGGKRIPYPNYNGFQIGKGIFDQMKGDIWDSLRLVLSGSMNGGSSSNDPTPENPNGGTSSSDNNGTSTPNGNPNNNITNPNKPSNGDSKGNTDSADSLDAVFCGIAAVAALGALVVIKKK